jgi:hypothetical protein
VPVEDVVEYWDRGLSHGFSWYLLDLRVLVDDDKGDANGALDVRKHKLICLLDHLAVVFEIR